MFELSWEVLYAWAGYDFWGVVLSLFGAAFAFRASRNAKRATEAATSAVQVVSSIEAVAEIGKLLRTLQEIRRRLDGSEWDLVSQHCSEAESIVTTLQSSSSVELSSDGKDALEWLAPQLERLATQSDKALHQNTAIDHVKVKNMLSRSKVKATRLEVELKEKAAEK